MNLRVGTSGYAYDEWKGIFYPEDLPKKDRLRYYGERLNSVEINNTFYRMPKAEMLAGWAEVVPEDFLFVLKASRRITHNGRLKDVADSVAYLWKNAQELGERLGPILFQLPPYLKKDAERLARFLDELPEGMRAVLEFRHESWFDDETFGLLRNAGAALCLADTEPKEGEEPAEPEIVSTADFGYLRLRRCDYEDSDLSVWRERIRAQAWKETFVFFKHEDEAGGPRFAEALLKSW